MSKVASLFQTDVFSQTMGDIARDIITFEINNSGFSDSDLKDMKPLIESAWEQIKSSEKTVAVQKAKGSLLLIAAHAYLVTGKQTDSKQLVDDVNWLYDSSV